MMVGKRKWLDTNADGHGTDRGNSPEPTRRKAAEPTVARPLDRRESTIDTYRVRQGSSFHFYGAPEPCWFVTEHRNGKVRIYGRFMGEGARESAEATAKDMNRKERAA